MDCFDDTTASIEKGILNIRFLGSSTIINFIWTPVLAWGWGYFLIRSSSFMDWFYYAYGDTLHGLVPRIYRHSKRECVSFNIDSTDQFDPASRTFTYIPTIIRWQHWNHSSPNTHWEYIDCTDLSFRACSPYTISIEKKRTSFKQYRHTLFQQCSDFLSIICDYGNVCFPRLILAWPFGSHLYLDYSYFDIFIINYVLGRLVGRLLKFSYEDTVSLSLTIIARNSPVALAIAVTAFPNQPLIASTLVIGPLIELPILAIVSQVLLFTKWVESERELPYDLGELY